MFIHGRNHILTICILSKAWSGRAATVRRPVTPVTIAIQQTCIGQITKANFI